MNEFRWPLKRIKRDILYFRLQSFGSLPSVQFSSIQSLSRVRLFVTPWNAARQASLSDPLVVVKTNSWALKIKENKHLSTGVTHHASQT